MTAGALQQIAVATSDRMAFLCLNPSITHFKAVYKKYTAFSIEYVNETATSSGSLSFDNPTTISFDIKRNGDLMKDIYLQIDLPSIYSTNGYNFQWIERLGEYIIRDSTVTINGTRIDRHIGEWLHIWSELTLPQEKRDGYYRMIGNTADMYDPANAPGNNGIYPDTTAISPYGTPRLIPSIKGRRLSIPLRFWFNNETSSAFPLIALQYAVFNITFNLRPLKELYTVVDVGDTGYRIRPNKNAHNIGNFLVTQSSSTTSINVNPTLEINYIFLDKDERKQFAISTHEYLITQLQYYYTNASTELSPKNIILSNTFSKPVTEFIVLIRRSDNEICNKWSNYTNWNSNIAPYSPAYLNENGPFPAINSTNFNYYYDNEILKSAVISINKNTEITAGQPYTYFGTSGINGKDRTFYNNVMNFAANKCIPSQGIYTYSFSLSNNNKQPDGVINMSNLSDVILQLYLNNIDPTATYSVSASGKYEYNIYVMAVNYEALRIIGGIASVAYSN